MKINAKICLQTSQIFSCLYRVCILLDRVCIDIHETRNTTFSCIVFQTLVQTLAAAASETGHVTDAHWKRAPGGRRRRAARHGARAGRRATCSTGAPLAQRPDRSSRHTHVLSVLSFSLSLSVSLSQESRTELDCKSCNRTVPVIIELVDLWPRLIYSTYYIHTRTVHTEQRQRSCSPLDSNILYILTVQYMQHEHSLVMVSRNSKNTCLTQAPRQLVTFRQVRGRGGPAEGWLTPCTVHTYYTLLEGLRIFSSDLRPSKAYSVLYNMACAVCTGHMDCGQ